MASQHFIQQSNETNKTLLQIKSMTSRVHTVYYVAIAFAIVSFLLALTLKKKDQQLETQ
ncbi:hypothetical protein ACW5UC_25980 [Priestia aryabhattai]